MATTFVKNGTNVLVTVGDNVMSAPGSAFVKPDPRDAGYIVISEKASPQNELDGIRICVADVTVPSFTDRNDLITQLSTDFFFRVNGAGFSNGYLVFSNLDTGFEGMNVRIGSRVGFPFAIDRELISGGFSGAENVGWENIGGNGPA